MLRRYIPVLCLNMVICAFCMGDDLEKAPLPKLIGWDKYATLGLYGTVNESSHVVGKDDGQSTTIGLKIDAGLDYASERKVWVNTINMLIAFSRSPLIPKNIKSEDTIELDSVYKHFFAAVPWLGWYAQGGIKTSGFPGYDNQPQDITYRKINLDGTEEDIISKRIRLTDEFLPLRLRESFGAITSIYDLEIFSWDFKAGLGYQQVFADGQYHVDDNEDTEVRELVEIQDYETAGYELATEIKGSTKDKKISYSLKAKILLPFYESTREGHDDSIFERRVSDLTGKASLHLEEWASIDYLLTIARDPNIDQKAQVSQSVLFSLNKTISERRSQPPET